MHYRYIYIYTAATTIYVVCCVVYFIKRLYLIYQYIKLLNTYR